jgi:uncharacterized protein
MAEPAAPDVALPAETTQDERTMAVLAHVLQLVGGWIAPLVIFLVKRQSRFVSFHALQVLFLQLVYLALVVCLMFFWISGILLTILTSHASNHSPPPAVFVILPLFWLGFMGIWVTTIVIAIVFSVKAGRGEWAEYPVLGKWARQILKIGPSGGPMKS